MSKKTKPKSKGKSAPKAKKPAVKKAAKKAAPAPKKKAAAKAKAPAKKAAVKKVAVKKAPAKKAPAKAPVKKASAPVKAVNKPAEKPLAKPVAKAVAPAPAPVAPKAEPKSVGRPMPFNRRPEPVIRPRVDENPGKTRYSDSELDEFRQIINKKLEDARKELALLQAQLTAANEHGTDDTASTFKILEDGSDSLAKEEAGQLAGRQKKFIEQLENALIRIENKTYGICRVTGKLIPKERLRAVPHTTQSIEAKLNQYRD